MTTWDGISAAQHALLSHSGLPGIGGGAKTYPPATYRIAASNSTADDKAAADLVCGGTADATEINAFLSGKYAQTFACAPGDYMLDGSIIPDTHTFVGMGNWGGFPSNFKLLTSTPAGTPAFAITSSYTHLVHLMIQPSAVDNVAPHIGVMINSSQCRIVDCFITNFGSYGLQAVSTSAGETYVIENVFSGNGQFGAVAAVAWAGLRSWIHRNWFVSNSGGAGLDLGGSDGNLIQSNLFAGNLYGIMAAEKASAGANRNLIQGNFVRQNSRDGIRVGTNGSAVTKADNAVVGNYVYQNGTQTASTYDNIVVDSGASNTMVQGNIVRRGASGNRARYGLNIAGGSGCWATNNDLLTGGMTGAFNDAGTLTNTTAGNRTA